MVVFGGVLLAVRRVIAVRDGADLAGAEAVRAGAGRG
jgi:hypothetical protein